MARVEGKVTDIGTSDPAGAPSYRCYKVLTIGGETLQGLHVHQKMERALHQSGDVAVGYSWFLWHLTAFAVATPDGKVIRAGGFRAFWCMLMAFILAIVFLATCLQGAPTVAVVGAGFSGLIFVQCLVCFITAVSFAPYKGQAKKEVLKS
ncbi:hypothetical protein OVY01_11890 [Robbsia sp. Bb-Pol-6]|uniref:Uncharacterized protein n=1 Tax=Robbsia betulipollinis TaxID=2981849 RepID=A0ABT3ZMZ9_9BURK|nr:hypothetical protein [Robbsia betulipollinis]MCY0387924.1 hypothetical protein [Robbsia betulipollinis]